MSRSNPRQSSYDFDVIDLFQQIVYLINFAEDGFLAVFCAIFKLFCITNPG